MIRRRRGCGRWLPPAIAIAAVSLATACAARRPFVPPAGPGAPAPDAAAAWDAASAACRSLSSYRAEFGLTGTIGARRLRGLASARLNVAVTAAAVGLDATVSGQLVFRLGGTADRAVLLLRDPDRVVTAGPEDVLEALIGVRLGPRRLLAVVGGCIAEQPAITRAARHGAVLEVTTADAVVYLELENGAWRVRAGRFGDVSVEYLDYASGRPQRIWLRSMVDAAPAVSLLLDVRQAVINTSIPAAALDVPVPPDAVTLSLDELRQVGPLGDDGAVR